MSAINPIKQTLLNKNINKGDIILENLTHIKHIYEKINNSNVAYYYNRYYFFNPFN